VDGGHRPPLGQGDFNPVSNEFRPRQGISLPPEPADDDAVGRPGEIATEEAKWDDSRDRPSGGDRRLEALLGASEFLRQLRREVLPRVDRLDERFPGRDRPVDRRPRCGGTRL